MALFIRCPAGTFVRLLALGCYAAPGWSLGAAQAIGFNRDIRPILSNTCFQCHGPDEKKRSGGLRLDLRTSATTELKSGRTAIVPGQPEASELFRRISSHDREEVMPPPEAKKPALDAKQIAVMREWIAQGAPYEAHWAFLPVAKVALPKVMNEAWGRNGIDRFVLARLEAVGISPSAEADPPTLLRRVSLDLTGLPPSAEESAAFEKSAAGTIDTAFAEAVDRLLASPHYGERWGRHWLDQARYADSNGYAIDSEREMWPYRDWVIAAFNRDQPFDQFTIEQLAGDLLPSPTKAQLAATAFHRNTLINEEGGVDPEQFRVEAVVDRVNTTGAVWLGLTVGCAQCHAHKYDPITQREFYQLFAFFNSCKDRNDKGPSVSVVRGELLGQEPPAAAATPLAATTPAAAGTEKEQGTAAGTTAWKEVSWREYDTAAGAGFEKLPDNSLLSDGRGAFNDTYRLVFQSTTDRVSAVRLRVLPHESLPAGGPGRAKNGNFVLTRIEITHDGKPLRVGAAMADFEQSGYPVAGTIDADSKSGWAINPGKGQQVNVAREAVFVFEQPIESGGKPFEVRLFHELNQHYLIGRLAFDSAEAPPVFTAPGSGKPAVASRAPGTADLMVLGELTSPRETFVLERGDFTRPNKMAGPIPPGVPAAVAASGDGPRFEFRNRLDLAKWLVDPANPLTARVTVNRIWMRYFGRGLVETEEDFGMQETPPTHPELLDWLAGEFIRRAWSMKELHRLIVTSATYRQSSHVRPDLEERDPRNLLLARQSRVRLEAEIIRDVALAASGLLDGTVGGPSVRPPQPDGVYAFTQVKKKWEASDGGDRHRRGLYTFFFRSAPYPLFGTFDAPDFQTTCTRRGRSNTPLQALALANDVAFLECAHGLAQRVMRDVPGPFDAVLEDRIVRACRLALARPPTARELALLRGHVRRQQARFESAPAEAALLAASPRPGTGADLADAAALSSAARVLLNLDAFITRE